MFNIAIVDRTSMCLADIIGFFFGNLLTQKEEMKNRALKYIRRGKDGKDVPKSFIYILLFEFT